MDIRLQSCGVILMSVLLYFYIRQKRIFLNTEKAFLRAFLVTLASIVMDILSIIALDYRKKLPELFVKFVCKSYLVTLLGVALCGLLYVCVDIYTKKNEYRKKVRKYEVTALLGILLIYLLPLHYMFAEDGTTVIYTYGASVIVTYLFAVSFLIIIACLMKKEKNRINTVRRQAVQLWMGIWMGASVVQYIYNDLLIVGYMSAIGMMILYLKLENPETNLDRQSGMFNHNALMQYTRQLFGKEQEFAILAIVLKNPLYEEGRSDQIGAVHMNVLEFLFNIEDAFVFKDMEDEILLVFEDAAAAEKGVQRILKRFQSGWGDGGKFYVKHCLIYVPNARIVNRAEDLLYLIYTIRQNSNEFSKGNLIVADKTKAEEMYQEKETEKLLEYAIENDRIEVFYQPIYSTKDNRFTSAEALVRIRDENGNIVSPGVFVGIAERNGAILSLGKIVFEKVCRMIKERDITRYGLHYMEVNLSVVQCAYEQLAEEYIQIMKTYGIPMEQINLEITESASLDAKSVLLKNMDKLIACDVRFSLDDFGTGQSNLNYIAEMPVDIVKFDRDMTTAYFESPKAKYVMDNAINMILGMNLEIVSEGIETEEQYKTMKELGISYIQGYYFSKPLAEDAFWDFICEHNGNSFIDNK